MSPAYPQLPPMILGLAAASWIVWQLASHGQPSMPDTSPPPTASVPSEQVPAGKLPVADYRPLARWHLFGPAAGEPSAGQGQAQAVPASKPGRPLPTPLKLSLRGVLLLPASGSVAFIRDASGHERGYRIGDALPGKARISGIASRQVLLERAGALETLRLSHPRPRDPQASSNGKSPRRVVAMTPRGSGVRR